MYGNVEFVAGSMIFRGEGVGYKWELESFNVSDEMIVLGVEGWMKPYQVKSDQRILNLNDGHGE